MRNEGVAQENRALYTSAIHSQKPITRRRQSGSTTGSDSNGSRDGYANQHGRYRTEITSGRANGGSSHPLKLNHTGLLDSSGVTRPHLSRVLNKVDGEYQVQSGNHDDSSARREDEKEVLVHEITPTDSLAGVSLRYGISLADLRRANQLWANDPIHLRKVLYIPLDKSLRARVLKQEIEAPLIDFSSSTSSQSSDTTTDNEGTKSVLTSNIGLGFQRVPVSRLSFFPPPSTTGKTPSISSTPSIRKVPNHKHPMAHSRYNSSPSSSLTSILTALPIAASTRDDILARISFDSVSSSVSDRSQASRELNEGLEMDIVSNVNASSKPTVEGTATSRMLRPRARYHRPDIPYFTLGPNASTTSRNNHSQQASSSPPTAYIPQIPDNTTVRTVQMEPSPMMKLPSSRSRVPQSHNLKKASVGGHVQVDDSLIEL